MRFPRTLLLLLAFTPLCGAQADAYKWVDENGEVHYGQQPPTGGHADRVPLHRGPEPGTGGLDGLRKRSQAAGAQRQASQDTAAEAQGRAERQRARVDACAKMRSNLDVLQSRTRVRELKGGQYVALTPEEQQARIGELQGRLEEHCQNL